MLHFSYQLKGWGLFCKAAETPKGEGRYAVTLENEDTEIVLVLDAEALRRLSFVTSAALADPKGAIVFEDGTDRPTA